MRVVITGGGGFLGHQLCEALMDRGSLLGQDRQAQAIEEIVLLDAAFPRPRTQKSNSIRVEQIVGSIESQEAIDAAVGSQPGTAIFHLASMVSGECEERFDEALRVNLHGSMRLLETARRLGPTCRFVFASSIACFGGPALKDPCDDWTKLTPQTTYGMTKAIVEMLIGDYARKGFVDGRAARLPTVIIRPGKPNAAASSWASGMFREPLQGLDCMLPVSLDQRHPMTSASTVIDSLMAIYNLPTETIGTDRAIGLDAMSITPRMAQQALLEATSGPNAIELPHRLGQIILKPDVRIERIVEQWPVAIDGQRAVSLGLPRPASLVEIIRKFVADFLD